MASGSEAYAGINTGRATRASRRRNSTPRQQPHEAPF